MTDASFARTRGWHLMGALAPLAWWLSGCHSAPLAPPQAPPPQQVAAPVEPVLEEPPAAEEPQPKAETLPPCVPAPTIMPPPKRKPKPAHRSVSPPPSDGVVSAPPSAEPQPSVKQLQASLASILGKKVQDAEGDDFGRIVDVLADNNGRVRLAVIEYGGFLGLGNRRVAVDWALLRFHTEDEDRPATLPVSEKQLRAIPVYKAPASPQALIAPGLPEADGKK
jgi:hypothetical protein